jgi:hypothetical protein
VRPGWAAPGYVPSLYRYPAQPKGRVTPVPCPLSAIFNQIHTYMTEDLNQFQGDLSPISGESTSTGIVSVPAIVTPDDFPDDPASVLDEFRPTEIYRVKMRLRSIKDGILMNPKSPEILLELAKLRQKEVDD